jgi:hypothetical protein
MRAWWFGCETKPAACGHYVHAAQPPWDGSAAYDEHKRFPFPWEQLDGGFAPRTRPTMRYDKGEELPQGQARLTYVGGWTVISFWDRSGDPRGASNTAFVFDEHIDGQAALETARGLFQTLFRRFPFEVKIVETVEL